MSAARRSADLPPVNRRRAWACWHWGRCPGRAGCVCWRRHQEGGGCPAGESDVDLQPRSIGDRCVAHRARANQRRRRLVPEDLADQRGGQGRRRCPQPRSHRFVVTEPLGYGAVYTWAGSVVGCDGKAGSVTEVQHHQASPSWSTVVPAVGRADRGCGCADHPAVRRADLRTRPPCRRPWRPFTTPPVEGSWAWLPDEAEGSRVHWRSRGVLLLPGPPCTSRPSSMASTR